MPGNAWQLHLEGEPGNACSGLVHRSLAPDWRQLRQTLTSRNPLPVLSMQFTGMF